MFAGVITLIFGIVISLIAYKKTKNQGKWIRIRWIIIIATIPIMIFIASYERSIGLFSTWFWAFFINGWELFCFDVGLLSSNLFIKLKMLK